MWEQFWQILMKYFGIEYFNLKHVSYYITVRTIITTMEICDCISEYRALSEHRKKLKEYLHATLEIYQKCMTSFSKTQKKFDILVISRFEF